MKIAIHCADLDHSRIDGTRVYILNMLRNFGALSSCDRFFLYHKKDFNPQLAPPKLENYEFCKNDFPFMWTQTRFALDVWKDKPDVVWLPMLNLPLLRRKNLRTVVTVHDLAFKRFPQYFPKGDLRKLNVLSDHSIANATKLIAVSESTKRDILEFYPKRKESDIKVIHHGFDHALFFSEEEANDEGDFEFISKTYNLKPKTYLLYVGAIQPRKNLETLVEAFEKIKRTGCDLKLVIAGEKAWMWERILERIESSPAKDDIILTGKVPFNQLPVLYRNAKIFVFPEKFAGFGIPILEAFASGTPVVAAHNSSLLEVGDGAALYFETENSDDLWAKIESVIADDDMRKKMIVLGRERAKEFSWEKCAQETLEWIKSAATI